MRNQYRLLGACIVLAATTLAHAEIVLIGHPSASAPSKEEIADVFLGRSTALTPADLPESSPLRADFYKKATGREPAQVKATWSRLTFSGKAQPPREFADAAAMKKAVAADPKLVGYIDKASVDGSVKVLATFP